MPIQKNDFIEIEYTGRLEADNSIFDTTDEKLAKEHELDSERDSFGPVVACIGENFLIKGLNDYLMGKEPGKEYTITIAPEDGFGKKDPKLLQMIPTKKFKEHQVDPQPGLQISIDGTRGTIKTVSGGRTMVDFNHPLSGHALIYEVKVNKIVDDEKTKVETFLKYMGLDQLDIAVENGVVTVKLQSPLDDTIKKEFESKVKEVIPSVKEVKFELQQKKEKKAQ